MQNLPGSYQFSDTLFRFPADPSAVFMTGAAAGFLFVVSLFRLWAYRNASAMPAGEYRLRIAPALSVLLSVLGMIFPFVPGFFTNSAGNMLAASIIFLAGLLGFELSLALLLLTRQFPRWTIKQLAPLPLTAVLAALLPLGGEFKAPFVLGCFSLALCALCAVVFIYCAGKKLPRRSFVWGTLIFFALGLAFTLPPEYGTFFWPAVFLAWLLLEDRIVPKTSAGLPVSQPVKDQPMEDQAVEELTEPVEDTPAAHVPAGAPPSDLPSIDPKEGSFVPREFLDILNKETVADLKLGDHIKREMTIFFSDIRQFTDLSENLTPEESFAFINSYLSRIVPEITKNGGFVDKYIGDAVLALFHQSDGPDMAVRTAIAIQEKIQEYNSHRANCGYRPLSMGIGIHTGTLMVGVVGTEDRMQSTVISDAVNLASRVESLTKAFGISLAISEETFKKLEDPGSYQYRFIGKVRVKGKSEPVSIFEIFDGIDEELQKKKIEANRFFEQGMFLYYQKKYAEALLEFRQVMEALPGDGASAFYIDNCMTKL